VHVGNPFSHFSSFHGMSPFDGMHRSGGGGEPERAQGPQPGRPMMPGFPGASSFTPFAGPPGQMKKMFGQMPTPPGQTPAPGQPGLPGQPPLGPGAQGDGVPWISQMDPNGVDKSYQNAAENCGPAVMAMLAREHGKGLGTDDADLITKLGQIGQTNGNGTTGNGLIAMGNELGLNSTAQPGANSAWVMDQLKQGKDVVANGNYYSLPQHADPADPTKNSPHYILLTGVDQTGNITVEDPMDPNVRSITPQQLDAFNNGQAQGGFNIAFS
jgi:peptidase C39-like protein